MALTQSAPTFKFLSGPGRVVVSGGTPVYKFVSGGPMGPPGIPGDDLRVERFYGEGPPGLVVGASPGDEYVDTLTGDLYVLM